MILSQELETIARDFCSGRAIAQDEMFDIGHSITLLAKLAKNQESELAVHRLVEAGKVGRAVVDQLANEQFSQLVQDADSKVIRLDFRGRS